MQRFNPDGIFRARFCFLILGCLATIYYPSPAPAQQRPGANLIDAAKKDGEVVWYTTTSNEDNQAVVNGFNKKYPFVEGQTAIRDRFRVPVRPGVAPAAPSLEQSDLKLHYVPADMFKKISLYEKEYREIFWQK